MCLITVLPVSVQALPLSVDFYIIAAGINIQLGQKSITLIDSELGDKLYAVTASMK